MPSNSIFPVPVDLFCWRQAMSELIAAMQKRAVHPADAVVLLPYAQLMQQARQAWALAAREADYEEDSAGASIFVPRFETTMNWASSLGGRLGPYTPLGADIRMDVAIDMLTAASLLQQAGMGAQQDLLSSRLVEADRKSVV